MRAPGAALEPFTSELEPFELSELEPSAAPGAGDAWSFVVLSHILCH
jgi:hypothetical protein